MCIHKECVRVPRVCVRMPEACAHIHAQKNIFKVGTKQQLNKTYHVSNTNVELCALLLHPTTNW